LKGPFGSLRVRADLCIQNGTRNNDLFDGSPLGAK